MTWVYFHYLFLLCFSAFHFFFPANFTSRAYPFPLVFLLYMMLDLFYFQYSYSDVREYYYCIRIRVARSTSAKNGKFTKKAKKSTSKNEKKNAEYYINSLILLIDHDFELLHLFHSNYFNRIIISKQKI